MNPNLFPQTSGTGAQPPNASHQSPDTSPRSNGLEPPANGLIAPIERLLYKLFSHKAIAMPTSAKDLLAEYLPWLVIIVGFVMFPIIITGIINSGAMGILTSISGIIVNPFYWATLVLFTAQFFCIVRSVLALLSHKRAGWKSLFWGTAFGVLTALTNIFAGFSDPLVTSTLLLGMTIVSFYVLFQVRSYFTE